MSAGNHRILIVDDLKSIHADFVKILGEPAAQDGLADLEQHLFGGTAPASQLPTVRFDLDFASQGLEGVEKVEKAMAAGEPYALAFVDVRMPPGLDGIETIVRLWELDPRLEIVICTAYSDYTWQQMLERLSRPGQFLVLGKPFERTAVRQMALALTEKWNLARAAERTAIDLDRLVQARTQQLVEVNAHLQAQMQERMELEKRLQHVQKLEAIGRLVAGVAHEINNPLSFVQTNLDHIEKQLRASEAKWGEAVRDLCEAAIEARMGGQRIKQIVHDLMTFSRPNQPVMDEVVLEDVIRFALRMAAPSFPPEIRVRTSFGAIPVLRTSAGMLSQVFLNLFVNAGHALKGVPGDRRELTAAVESTTGDCVLVTVRDTGVGIREEVMPRIFEPFFTTRSQGEGTGLGLSICRGIIKRLGGEIRIESQEGVGTSALVFLPRSPPEEDNLTSPVALDARAVS